MNFGPQQWGAAVLKSSSCTAGSNDKCSSAGLFIRGNPVGVANADFVTGGVDGDGATDLSGDSNSAAPKVQCSCADVLVGMHELEFGAWVLHVWLIADRLQYDPLASGGFFYCPLWYSRVLSLYNRSSRVAAYRLASSL
jgi:hypothetical protein